MTNHYRVLALSSSRVGNSGYLEKAIDEISKFLGKEIVNIAFVPFAAADGNYKEYVDKVKEATVALPYNILLAEPQNAKDVIKDAQAIMVGGGNTFKLLHDLYELNLMELIENKVRAGAPYVGWSAGSNLTGLTIGTTNDMPILEPKSFRSFGFFPIQINPHYYNVKIEGHNGETRDERLTEFLKVNPGVSIVGLPEGTALIRDGNRIQLVGSTPAMLFESTASKETAIRRLIDPNTDLSYLLNSKKAL
jgi:dipeptidase E